MFEELLYKDLDRELVYMRRGRIEVSSKLANFQPTLLSKVFAMIGFVPYYIDKYSHLEKVIYYEINVTTNENKELISATVRQ